MFLLWNETDQILASPEEFKTKGAAEAPSRLLWKIEKRNLWLKKPYNHAS